MITFSLLYNIYLIGLFISFVYTFYSLCTNDCEKLYNKLADIDIQLKARGYEYEYQIIALIFLISYLITLALYPFINLKKYLK